MGFLGIRIGEGISKCKKKMRATFAGRPDLVVGAEALCNEHQQRYLNMSHDEIRRFYLEEVLGDQASLAYYGIDADPTSGIGSAKLAQQEQIQQLLFGFQQQQQNLSAYNDKIAATTLAITIAQEEEQRNGQQKLIYVALIVLVLFFITTQIFKK